MVIKAERSAKETKDPMKLPEIIKNKITGGQKKVSNIESRTYVLLCSASLRVDILEDQKMLKTFLAHSKLMWTYLAYKWKKFFSIQ